MQKIGVNLDLAKLEEFILQLPPSEQNLVSMDFKRYAFDPQDNLFHTLQHNIPFCHGIHDELFYLPSATLMNYLFEKVSSSPVQMKPGFG